MAIDNFGSDDNKAFLLLKENVFLIISILIFGFALFVENFLSTDYLFYLYLPLIYTFAYLPAGVPVIIEAYNSIKKGEIFSEFFLMSIATIGAFAIGEYSEGVAVMLFYSIGEILQTMAVRRAKHNIESLLDQRPDEVTLSANGIQKVVRAEEAKVGDIIELKPGEKLGLDGTLLSERASFNVSALTGESKPETKFKGDTVLAGMINLNSVTEIKVSTEYANSKLSKILELVQNAVRQKAPTELYIRKLSKIYTPAIVSISGLIFILPYFFYRPYIASEWFYKALVFLVVSCPCALVISIPLGYFGGIGAASKYGILFKGSNFLDVISTIQNVVMDKTGTLTEGVFKVQEVQITSELDTKEILKMVNLLESKSTHPIATAIHDYLGIIDNSIEMADFEEIPGFGLKAKIKQKPMLVGNFKLLKKYSINYSFNPATIPYTTIAIAYDNQYVGYITIADRIKADSKTAIDQLRILGVKTTMLSGDRTKVVEHVAKSLNIDRAFGDLLPEDKVAKVKELIDTKESVAFVGDGVNDAPAVALSNIGIAMGGLGSDATIETADLVIQDDRPSKIPLAIKLGRLTKRIVRQNIVLAFTVKFIVLILSAGGIATMWEAVFADVGVTIVAILNSIRVLRYKYLSL